MSQSADHLSRGSTSIASSELYAVKLGTLIGSEREYAYWDWKYPLYSAKDTAEAWVTTLPDSDEMINPAEAINGRVAFTMPFMGQAEVEKTLYDREDPYADCADLDSPFNHEVGIHRPLDLLRRFRKEVQWFEDQSCGTHGYPPAPLPSDEMVKRRWEQVFSSRLPPIEKPLAHMPNGEPVTEYVERGLLRVPDHCYETLFVDKLVTSLRLMGRDEDHPAKSIRMPRILAQNPDWQEFAVSQAWYFAKKDETRRSWMSFLVTRPFAVFQVICDAERRRRGYTKEMVLKSWKDRGYWIGGRWSEDGHGPGWTWPCEDPSYFLDDFVGTWELADELWLGDPQGPDGPDDNESVRADPVTEEELVKDPILSHRQQDWVKQYQRVKRRRAREEANLATGIHDSRPKLRPPTRRERGYCDPPPRDTPRGNKNVAKVSKTGGNIGSKKRAKKCSGSDADAPAPRKRCTESPCNAAEIVAHDSKAEAAPETETQEEADAEVPKHRTVKGKPLEATRRSSRLARRPAGTGLA